jgi:thiamine biosynthesis lipoprotein
VKRLSVVLAALGAIAIVCSLLAWSLSRPRLYQRRALVMSTGFSAKAVFSGRSAAGAGADLDAALEEARRAERLMSRFLPDSDVSRLSAAEPGTAVSLDPHTLQVLGLAKEINRRSGGAFDVTVGPLVRLYKYTGREEGRRPTDAEIAAALKLVGSDKLILDPGAGTASLRFAGMTVDLSAVAKGFGVDRALAVLRDRGARAAVVEIGGEVAAFGRKPDGSPWRVGVQHPRSGEMLARLDLTGGAVATSGDYQKYFKRGGRRASHIVDPRTGRPLIGGAVSVTVLAPTCALADGLATAISVLGPAEGLKLVAGYRREGRAVEAIVIEETEAGKLVPHTSPGLRDLKLDP